MNELISEYLFIYLLFNTPRPKSIFSCSLIVIRINGCTDDLMECHTRFVIIPKIHYIVYTQSAVPVPIPGPPNCLHQRE